MNTSSPQSGSSGYLYMITSVAILGGLLFGYDTAVISGAEKALQTFFHGAKDFEYTSGWHGVTASSALNRLCDRWLYFWFASGTFWTS